MSSNSIIRWTEESAHTNITGYTETQVLEPESIYPGWMNLVAQRSIRAIAIGPKSRHVWLATWGGVLSWRQREETTYYRYSSEHGLAGNGVSCICVDEVERPWVGHNEGGLAYYETKRWQVYPERQTEIFRVVSNAAPATGIWAATDNCIYYISGPGRASAPLLVNQAGADYPVTLLSDGEELLMGNNLGLFRIRTTGELVPVKPDLVKSCTSLSRDLLGRIWIAATDQIYMMEAGEINSQPFYDGSAGRVRQIAAGLNRVWILTTGGLSVIDNDGWKPIPVTSEPAKLPALQTIAASLSDNHLWVGTDCLLSSLFYSADETVYWEHSLLPKHSEDELNNLGRCIVASEADNQEILIGTAGGLVTCQADNTWSIDQMKGDVRQLCITSSVQGETRWLLNWPKGFSASHGPFKQPAGIPIALAKGQDGNAYGLTSRGLWLLSEDLKQIADGPPERALYLAQTEDGTLWTGTAHGVYGYAKGAWKLADEQPGPHLSEVYALLAIGSELWAATSSGLWCRRGNLWESHNSQQPRIVRALAPANGEGKLWLAQQDGVVRYTPKNQTIDKSYSLSADGLASNRIAALAEIRGDLWIVTEAGISRLRFSEEVI